MLTLLFSSFLLLLLPLLTKHFSWLHSFVTLFFATIGYLIFALPPHTYQTIFNKRFSTDFLSLPLILLTIWISALIIIARFSIKNKNLSPEPFLFLILLLNFALLLTFSTSNLLTFYISFEFTLLPTLFIILGWGYQPERLQAGFYLLIYTVLASLPLLINLILVFKHNQSLSFRNYIWTLPCHSTLMFIWWITTILAFLVKIPLYIFHLWLPKAHVEAPVAGSIILAGLLLKLGSYGILRLALIFINANKLLLPLILSISIWGAVITRIICTRQPDIKSLIAYSSVGHIGLLTAGTITNQAWAWERSLLIITAHGLCSSALFALANILYETTQTRRLYLTKGIITLFPATTIIWFLASSANMAAPTSLNLIAEIILLSSILSASLRTAPILAISAFLAAVYSLFLYTSTQHGKPSNFTNPLHLFPPRNYLTILIHLLPLFTLCLKIDLTTNWL